MRSMAPSLKCCYPGLIESHIVKHRGYLDTKLNEDDDWYYDRIVFKKKKLVFFSFKLILFNVFKSFLYIKITIYKF
jgi:hypothetical protein